jgi:hypothetical protein
VQRFEAVGDAHGMARAAVLGEFVLEALDLLAKDQPTGI